MTRPLVFIDTETTGLHPQRLAWEVAGIRREPDGSEARLHLFVDVMLDEADPAALRMSRFYDRHPSYSPSPRPALDEYDAAVQVEAFTRGGVLVGSNPAFDAGTLAAMLRRNGLIEAWHYQVIDIVPLAAGALPRTRRPEAPWRSYEVSELLGVPRPAPEVAHTAMGDAEWARAVFDRVVKGSRR